MADVAKAVVSLGFAPIVNPDECPDPRRGTWPDEKHDAQSQSDQAVSKSVEILLNSTV